MIQIAAMLQIFFFFSEEAENENPLGKGIGLRKLSGNCESYSIMIIMIEN